MPYGRRLRNRADLRAHLARVVAVAQGLAGKGRSVRAWPEVRWPRAVSGRPQLRSNEGVLLSDGRDGSPSLPGRRAPPRPTEGRRAESSDAMIQLESGGSQAMNCFVQALLIGLLASSCRAPKTPAVSADATGPRRSADYSRCSWPVDDAIPLEQRALFACSCPAPPPSDNVEEAVGSGKHIARICAPADCDPKEICKRFEADRPERFRTGCYVAAAPVAFARIDDAHRFVCLMQNRTERTNAGGINESSGVTEPPAKRRNQ